MASGKLLNIDLFRVEFFGFAGGWECWMHLMDSRAIDPPMIDTFSMFTAGEMTALLQPHDRMPVIQALGPERGDAGRAGGGAGAAVSRCGPHDVSGGKAGWQARTMLTR